MRLLPPSDLFKTSKIDHAEWNFTPILGWLQRSRFRLVQSLLEPGYYGRLLEVGYGSGVFMPELSRYCDALYGLDVHDKERDVAAVLQRHGVDAQLHSASATRIPFPDDFFDCIVAVSALEYVDAVDVACQEIRRVLRQGGIVVVVTPGQSRLLDAGLKLLGEDPEENYADRRRRLMPAFKRHFAVERVRRGPPGIAWALPIYTALRLRKP